MFYLSVCIYDSIYTLSTFPNLFTYKSVFLKCLKYSIFPFPSPSK